MGIKKGLTEKSARPCFVWLPDALRDDNWTIVKRRKSKYEFETSSSE